MIDSSVPGTRVIDVTHGIDRGDVRRGAVALLAFVQYSAPAIHLALVDRGVGGDHRPVALDVAGHSLVGPDNGLLMPAAERLGGPIRAFDISQSPVILSPAHRTFHGRDIFSPVAASLAAGTPTAELGLEMDPGSLTGLDLPVARLEGGELTGHVLFSDGYGNLSLNIGPELILESFLKDGESVRIESEAHSLGEVRFGSAFRDVEPGVPLLFPNPSGNLRLSVNMGSAAIVFGLGHDDELSIQPVAR